MRKMEGCSEEEEKEEERGWWRGEGQSAALHDKDVGVVVGILCTQAGYYLFLHMSFQPIPPKHTQAEEGCLTLSWVRAKGLAFYLSL